MSKWKKFGMMRGPTFAPCEISPLSKDPKIGDSIRDNFFKKFICRTILHSKARLLSLYKIPTGLKSNFFGDCALEHYVSCSSSNNFDAITISNNCHYSLVFQNQAWLILKSQVIKTVNPFNGIVERNHYMTCHKLIEHNKAEIHKYTSKSSLNFQEGMKSVFEKKLSTKPLTIPAVIHFLIKYQSRTPDK